jgi:microcystin degradation protein MlrC
MTRIAVGGFLHETNTFAPTKATYDDFVHGGGWPSMAHGADVLKVMRNINVGLAGFVEAAETNGWELIPTISCGASPSAHVTKDAFERIVAEMIDGIAKAGRLDAVYLDLHGAMVTERLDDGEGEILARVRQAIGKDLPLVASLDLHANVTPEMVEHADALIAYRTYPHVDMADTGRASARHLGLLLKTEQRFAKAFRQLPFLIPISWQCTNDQPTRGIYEKLAALEGEAVPTLSFTPGFPAADFSHCGPSVFAYGRTQADADAAADEIAAIIEGHEDDFDGKIYSPDEGVLAHRRRPRRRQLAQGAACGSSDVPLCRHRTDRAGDPRQQELGAFPRRFRADRRKAFDLRRARRHAGRYGLAPLEPAASGDPHQAERHAFHTIHQITFNRIRTHAHH